MHGTTLLAACLASATLCAGCDQGCPPNMTDSFSTEPVEITLLDAVTGAPVCDAEVAATPPCPGCPFGTLFTLSSSADASTCSYRLMVSIAGPMPVSVTASGFAPKTVTVDVAGQSCGHVGGYTTTTTIRLSPE